MGKIERNWLRAPRRRDAIRALAGFFAGSSLLRSQQDPFRSGILLSTRRAGKYRATAILSRRSSGLWPR